MRYDRYDPICADAALENLEAQVTGQWKKMRSPSAAREWKAGKRGRYFRVTAVGDGEDGCGRRSFSIEQNPNKNLERTSSAGLTKN